MFTIDWLFYQQRAYFTNTCSQWGRSEARIVFCDERTVCVGGRAGAVRVDSGGVLRLRYSII